jgi:hypothetical protein
VILAPTYRFQAWFDFPPHLRWTARSADSGVGRAGPQPILLGHILFTQGLPDGSLPWRVHPRARKVGHEVHDLVNAAMPEPARTSGHCR